MDSGCEDTDLLIIHFLDIKISQLALSRTCKENYRLVTRTNKDPCIENLRMIENILHNKLYENAIKSVLQSKMNIVQSVYTIYTHLEYSSELETIERDQMRRDFCSLNSNFPGDEHPEPYARVLPLVLMKHSKSFEKRVCETITKLVKNDAYIEEQSNDARSKTVISNDQREMKFSTDIKVEEKNRWESNNDLEIATQNFNLTHACYCIEIYNKNKKKYRFQNWNLFVDLCIERLNSTRNHVTDIERWYYLYLIEYFLKNDIYVHRRYWLVRSSDLMITVLNKEKYAKVLQSAVENDDLSMTIRILNEVIGKHNHDRLEIIDIFCRRKYWYDDYNCTGFMIAIRINQVNVVKYLLEMDIFASDNPTAGMNEKYATRMVKMGIKCLDALRMASSRKYTDMTELLLNYGAADFIDCVNDKHRQAETQKLFVDYTFNKKHKYNDTIIAEFLIDNKGIDIDMRHDGITCLMNACECENLEMVQFLVNKGCDINLLSKNEHTFWQESALHIACKKGMKFKNKAIIKYLLQNGADINIRNDHGWTPLMEACWCGYEELVRYLININDKINQCAK